MTARLRGRVGVVTGAGRGVGREIALALSADGMHLALLFRTGAEVRDVAGRITEERGLPVLPFAVDVSDPAAVERVVAHVEQHLGPVDLLVNADAVVESCDIPAPQAAGRESRAAPENDLRGPLLLCRALLPVMVQRGHGHVVTVASGGRTAAETGGHGAHAVSEGALSRLAEALDEPLAGTGVVLVDVLAGPVRTERTDRMPLSRGLPGQRFVPAALTATVVADVAAGHYDDHAGGVLDVVSLSRG